MARQTSRRDFLKTTSAAGVGVWIAGGVRAADRPAGPNDRLNVAFVGCGGRGGGNINGVMGTGQANCVALCDVDQNRARGAFNRFPNVRKFDDYRRMLDQMGNQIDAVVVSTPDHTHAHISIAAMLLGKHVYCEKPLTHSVWEARQMKLVAQRQRVATQMGNQGTSNDNFRRSVEILRVGTLGPIREVHVWTNRPIWPQSDIWQRLNRDPGPLPRQDVPRTLSWDNWLGPAPERPYNSAYVPFNWRGWWDFGTGAIGDMACHTMNLPFMGLNLEAPTAVSAIIDDRPHNRNDQTPPVGCIVTFEFPARGNQPAFRLKWYERHRPPRELFHGQRISGSGALIVGRDGTMYQQDDYGARTLLLPVDQFRDFTPPQPSLPRSPGHHREWINACRGGRPAVSNFVDYAAKLTETALLGNVAIRCGQRFTWDAENLRTNLEAANRYIRREYRRGWELRTTPRSS